MSSANDDSVPLDELDKSGFENGNAPRLQVSNIKLLLALFVIFVTVVSDPFINTLHSVFGEKAVKGRTPAPWGVILQGIFLVFAYTIAIYLTECDIL